MSAGPLLFTAVLLLYSSAPAAGLPAAYNTASSDSAPCRPQMRLFLFGPEGCLLLRDSLELPDSLWLESLERLREELSELPKLLERRDWRQESERLRQRLERERERWQRWFREHQRFLEEEPPRQHEQELRKRQRQLEREHRTLERRLRELERELERLRQQLEHLRSTPLEL